LHFNDLENFFALRTKWSGPNGEGLPTWPAYRSADSWKVLHLDAQTTAAPDRYRDRYLFYQKYWSR
jgi:para-nitrobenzyl esterase